MTNISTCDLLDAHGPSGRANACDVQFHQYGGKLQFAGPVHTIKCHEDNTLVKQTLGESGNGGVLAVDGGGSLRYALLGDIIGEMAVKNGWAGVIIFGAVRDTVALKSLDVGIKALGANPRRSLKNGGGMVDAPVSFGNVTFKPGGWIYSDEDGVLFAESELT